MLTSVQARDVTRVHKHISIFISHCEQDNDEAKYYEMLFNKSGFKIASSTDMDFDLASMSKKPSSKKLKDVIFLFSLLAIIL